LLMSSRFHAFIGLAAFLALCSAGIIHHAYEVYSWGDSLDTVDAYSEANAVREVQGFREQGLWANHGLGNVFYGGAYPTMGFIAHPEDWEGHLTPSGVYTHYPPGPEYLLYAAARVFGPKPLSRLRALPLLISCIATLYFGLSLRSRFGAGVAWVVMFACLALPIFTNASAQLHYIGYAMALFLIEIGLSIRGSRLITPFLLLGFVQGWMSFDYFFLVTLAPVAIELALPRIDPTYKSRFTLSVIRSLAAGGGFATAHALHFLEVWGYLGTFQSALQDLRGVAAERSDLMSAGLLMMVLKMDVIVSFFWLGQGISASDPQVATLWKTHVFRFLGLSLGFWWIIITMASYLANLINLRFVGSTNEKFRKDWLIVCLCGFIPSSLWIIVMFNHATVHKHFILRHLFFAFFLTLTFIVNRLYQPVLDLFRNSTRDTTDVPGMVEGGMSTTVE
jgi:hypothetical protein